MNNPLEDLISDIIPDNINQENQEKENLIIPEYENQSFYNIKENYQQTEKIISLTSTLGQNKDTDMNQKEDIEMEQEKLDEINNQQIPEKKDEKAESQYEIPYEAEFNSQILSNSENSNSNQISNLKKNASLNEGISNPSKGKIIFTTLQSSSIKNAEKSENLSSNNNYNSENATEEQEYFVEKIVRKRTTPDLRYLVKWVGWEEKYSTWEPLEHLMNVTHLIDEFEKHEAIKIQKKIEREYYKSPQFPQTSQNISHKKMSDEDEEYNIEDEDYKNSDSDTSFDYYTNNNNYYFNKKRGGRGRGRGSKNYGNRNNIRNLNDSGNNKICDLNSMEEESFQKRTTEEGENEYNSNGSKNLFNKDCEEKNDIIRKIKPKEFKEKLLNKLDDNEICYNINNILDELMKQKKNDSDASFQKILTGKRRGRKKKCEFIDDGTNAYTYSKDKNKFKNSFINDYNKNNLNNLNSKDYNYKNNPQYNEKNKFSSIRYYRELEKNISENEALNQNSTGDIVRKFKKFELKNKSSNKNLYSQDFTKRKSTNHNKKYERDFKEDENSENSESETNKNTVDGFEVIEEMPEEDNVDVVLNVKRINDDLHCLVKFMERSNGVMPDDAFVPGNIISQKFPDKLIDFYESKIVFR